MRHIWTQDRDDRLRELWAANHPTKEIAFRMLTTVAAIEDRRAALDLPRRKPLRLWTPDREAEAKRLYIDQGKSARETAILMGGGVTRNAVIGIAHRRGWVKDLPAAAPTTYRPPRAPRVRPVAINRPPKPGPHDRPADVFGKLSTLRDPVKLEARREERAAVGKAANVVVSAGASVESPNARPFMEAVRGCKWPIGTGLAMLYCCNPVVGGEGLARNYCAGHRAIAMSPNQPKGDEKASRLARFDRVERAPRQRAEPISTLWDDAREAA